MSPTAFTQPVIDFDSFHRDELPSLLAERAAIASTAARHCDPLAIRLPGGRAYTYVPRADTVDIAAGDDRAATVIELAEDDWSGMVRELEAPAGLLYSGRARCTRGQAIDLMAWEAGLRALYNGVPLYRRDQLDLRDRDGRALDLEHTFGLLDADDEMRHFLRVAGYVFVRDVFSAGEIAELRDAAARLRQEARPGDRLSWWGRNAAGDETLCRVTRGMTQPALARLPSDARLLRLQQLADEGLVHTRGEGDGVTVIFKNPDMVEGLSDIPWHRDCGMGGHAVMCPRLILSLYLTEATPESGELMMLPGSRGTTFNAHLTGAEHLQPARFRAAPGDVSVHYSDTVHAAPPPTGRGLESYRTSAILAFARPDARHHRNQRSYNDALHRRDDGQIEHLEKVAGR